ncbi:hypothetical protein Tco_0572939 [Tanacetum coccineum]
MIAYLKKPTRSEGFQEIVDFLNGCHIRYALTKNPTIYVSLIEKFWQTATVRIVNNREQEITATVDGKEFTITEASVRRHLQLADPDGITVLPTTGIFDQLSLMGYDLTDDKLTFQKAEEDEGSGNPFKPQPPPSTAQPTIEEPIPDIESSSHQKTQTPRQALNKDTKLPQTSVPIPNVPDEAVYEEKDDIVERATTTASSLDVAVQVPRSHGGSIAQTRSKKGSSFGDRLKVDKESIWYCLYQAYHEDQLGVLSAAKVLADATKKSVKTYTRRRRAVSTGSVSTAGMVQDVSIPSPSETKDKERARLLAELIDKRKKLQAAQRYDFDELKNLFEATMRRVGTFVPIETEIRREVHELAAGKKEDDELSQKELQQLMIIVPEERMNVEALQTKYPIIDWEVYTETRRYWRIIRVGNHIEAYQIFADMLKKFDRDDPVKLWDLIEPTYDKEKEL